MRFLGVLGQGATSSWTVAGSVLMLQLGCPLGLGPSPLDWAECAHLRPTPPFHTLSSPLPHPQGDISSVDAILRDAEAAITLVSSGGWGQELPRLQPPHAFLVKVPPTADARQQYVAFSWKA